MASAALALAASAVLAHGRLEMTTPAEGAVLASPPGAVTIRFDSPHRVTLLSLRGPDGQTERLTANEGMAPSKQVTAQPPPLAPGAYVLEWRALAPDGHAVSGRVRFTYAPE